MVRNQEGGVRAGLGDGSLGQKREPRAYGKLASPGMLSVGRRQEGSMRCVQVLTCFLVSLPTFTLLPALVKPKQRDLKQVRSSEP